MLALFLLLSALNSSSSTPVSILTDDTNHPPIILFGRDVPECMNIPRFRTMEEIVWSCLVTIFACSWVAVHPNLPGPYDSGWTKLKRKVTIMIYAILTPELMTMWAMGQYFEAQKIAKEFNKTNAGGGSFWCWAAFKDGIKQWFYGPEPGNKSREWKDTHGFFLQMGGFLLCDGETPIRVLEFEELKKLVAEGKVDLPRVTEDEITDKSKGDFLTKLFVVIQTSWFVFQCLARWVTQLPVTELEVVTLAFATLNVITYGLWWNKPQNVLVAISVPMKSGVDNKSPTVIDEEERWIVRKVKEAKESSWWIVAIPWRLFQAFMRPFGKMSRSTKCTILFGSLRVPMFYISSSETTTYVIGADRGNPGADFPILAIGFLFGGLHLIPWSSDSFPSIAERWLWRSSALIITVEPICLFLLGPSKLVIDSLGSVPSFLFIPASCIAYPCVFTVATLSLLGIPLYLLSRLTLLVLSFTTLRDLPPGAYANIQWTTFVPHI